MVSKQNYDKVSCSHSRAFYRRLLCRRVDQLGDQWSSRHLGRRDSIRPVRDRLQWRTAITKPRLPSTQVALSTIRRPAPAARSLQGSCTLPKICRERASVPLASGGYRRSLLPRPECHRGHSLQGAVHPSIVKVLRFPARAKPTTLDGGIALPAVPQHLHPRIERARHGLDTRLALPGSRLARRAPIKWPNE